MLHIEIDTAGSGMAPTPGDSLGIIASNDAQLVEAVLSRLGWNGDRVFAVAPASSSDAGQKLLQHLHWPCSLRHALTHGCDIASVPRWACGPKRLFISDTVPASMYLEVLKPSYLYLRCPFPIAIPNFAAVASPERSQMQYKFCNAYKFCAFNAYLHNRVLRTQKFIIQDNVQNGIRICNHCS